MGATWIGIRLFLLLFIHLYTTYAAASFPLNPRLSSTDYFQQNRSENETGRCLYVQGKANLVPVYAAGAARQRHRQSHRSFANCRQSCAGFSSMVIAAALASLLPFDMVF